MSSSSIWSASLSALCAPCAFVYSPERLFTLQMRAPAFVYSQHQPTIERACLPRHRVHSAQSLLPRRLACPSLHSNAPKALFRTLAIPIVLLWREC